MISPSIIILYLVAYEWKIASYYKLKRSGFLPQSAPAALDLACDVDARLVRAVITDPGHVLHKHLPEARQINYNLRPRAHGFRLPLNDDRNFIPRLLFKDMY